jgi:hypothetical protein
MYLEESVVVDRPIGEVWTCLADLFNAPRLWGRRILAMRQTSPGPLGLGTTMQGRMVIFGFETRLNIVVTEWAPPHMVAMSMTLHPFGPTVGRWALETVGNGTRLVRSGDLELRGPLKFVGPLLKPYLRRGMHDASRSLKQFIESRPRSV